MKNTQKLVLAAMFLAIGHILPFFTGQIPQIGRMLLPMHIPVLLCGLVCGWQYGLAVGFVLPIMRSMIFSMPLMFPDAVSMAFELATYGGVVGYLFSRARWQCILSLYRCMFMAMICGRIVWGIVRMACMGLGADVFTVKAFLTGAFINAVPGIILQLIVVPAIMLALDKTHLVPFRNHSKKGAGLCHKMTN